MILVIIYVDNNSVDNYVIGHTSKKMTNDTTAIDTV